MTREAIILAGGLGTRLKNELGQLPKCMAPVDGIPFINFLVSYLRNEGINRFIFSLGYQHAVITKYLDKAFSTINKVYVIEAMPLGTGGAIQAACRKVHGSDVIIINGDTLFNIDLEKLSVFHHSINADCTIGLKEMTNFNRYGRVEINALNRVTSFYEKADCKKGLINAGVYVLRVQSLLSLAMPEEYSFETKYLEKHVGTKKMYGLTQQSYFMDIGIPEDYKRFQEDYRRAIAKINYNNTREAGTDILVNAFLGCID